MTMLTRPFLLHALFPLHAGTGRAAEVIDLPSARYKARGHGSAHPRPDRPSIAPDPREALSRRMATRPGGDYRRRVLADPNALSRGADTSGDGYSR